MEKRLIVQKRKKQTSEPMKRRATMSKGNQRTSMTIAIGGADIASAFP
jgi:hypothetical protein